MPRGWGWGCQGSGTAGAPAPQCARPPRGQAPLQPRVRFAAQRGSGVTGSPFSLGGPKSGPQPGHSLTRAAWLTPATGNIIRLCKTRDRLWGSPGQPHSSLRRQRQHCPDRTCTGSLCCANWSLWLRSETSSGRGCPLAPQLRGCDVTRHLLTFQEAVGTAALVTRGSGAQMLEKRKEAPEHHGW